MKGILVKLGSCVCACALTAGVMAGCAGGAASIDSSQQTSRAYMSQVNEVMVQLGDDLDAFVDAVSRGDVVNMRTQANNAYRALDELSALEAPDELSDIKKNYVDGTAKLREALDGYVELYTQVDAGSFDQSTYESRIADIQSLYDEGVSLLKQGDEAAASKQ